VVERIGRACTRKVPCAAFGFGLPGLALQARGVTVDPFLSQSLDDSGFIVVEKGVSKS
jgi:hypothetical protein